MQRNSDFENPLNSSRPLTTFNGNTLTGKHPPWQMPKKAAPAGTVRTVSDGGCGPPVSGNYFTANSK